MKRIAQILILIIIPFVLFGQERIFYSADKFQGSESSEGPIKEYFGSVKLVQGDVTITCNYAKLYENTNISYLSGNVKLVQNDLTMKTQEATYYGNRKFTKSDVEIEITDEKTYLKAMSGDYNSISNIANFYKQVYIEDDSVIVNSNFLRYNKNTQDSYAYNNVLIKAKFNNSYLLSDTLEYFPRKKYSISYGKPTLYQIDTLENNEEGILFDTLSIASDTMEAFRYIDDEHYKFTDSVVIIRQNIKAMSGAALYNQTNETFELTKSPLIWYDNSQLYGDSIHISLQEKKLKRIMAIGDAFSVSKELEDYASFLNQISGFYIEMLFEDGKINQIITQDNAKSLYFSQNEAGAVDAHKHDCNRIEMFFANDEIDRINFLGNVNASALPYQDIRNNVKGLYLPRYQWNENIPKTKKLEYKSNYFEL